MSNVRAASALLGCQKSTGWAGEASPAPSFLYFGCRNEAADFYYRGFWEACRAAGVLDREAGLVAAFSRDQARKVYVGQRLRETAPAAWAALQQARTAIRMHACMHLLTREGY